MNRKNYDRVLTAMFLAAEGVLYYFILTAGGRMLVISEYAGIVLCLMYALLHVGKGEWLIQAGLLCTLGADFFLVVCSPLRQLPGMVCFLFAQGMYALWLHGHGGTKLQLWLRLGIAAAAMLATLLVLRENTDALALVSLCYYANLTVNLGISFTRFRERRLLSIGFVLFLLCDTVIGLQMANGVYFPIPEGSVIDRILSLDINLAWLFYLPSQVLIALSSKRTRMG